MTNTQHTMAYAQAKMVVWNHDTYDDAKVNDAALTVMASLTASSEDVAQADHCLRHRLCSFRAVL
jgi:hypothetical protein